jgi:hypothetical protein
MHAALATVWARRAARNAASTRLGRGGFPPASPASIARPCASARRPSADVQSGGGTDQTSRCLRRTLTDRTASRRAVCRHPGWWSWVAAASAGLPLAVSGRITGARGAAAGSRWRPASWGCDRDRWTYRPPLVSPAVERLSAAAAPLPGATGDLQPLLGLERACFVRRGDRFGALGTVVK